ncbi:Uncharacterised protein [Vibrio cholerae]|nr:Uncharacterised protein [Vibrio cholerae]
MSMGIVDRFKTVNINVQQSKVTFAMRALSIFKVVFNGIDKIAPIRQVG